jgi:hypothetical protein
MNSTEISRDPPNAGQGCGGAPLYAPGPEHVVATNAWAFLHWLRVTGGPRLTDWSALQRFSAAEPARFAAFVADFAQLPAGPIRLVRHRGEREALVRRPSDGTRHAFTRHQLCAGDVAGLPSEIGAQLTRDWPAAELVGPLAELLLHADLRPDDRLLVADAPIWPWLAALLEGTTVILADPPRGSLFTVAAEEHATVLVTPAVLLERAISRDTDARRPCGKLRSIIATGGPPPLATVLRISAMVAPGLMVLARSDETLWGSPLDPVFDSPRAAPTLLARRR